MPAPVPLSLFAVLLAMVMAGPEAVAADDLEGLLSGFEEAVTGPVNQDQEPALEELLEGFGEGQPGPVEGTSSPAVLPGWLDLKGSVGLQSTVNFSQLAPEPGQPDYRGLSMMRPFGEVIGDAGGAAWKARLGVSMFYDGAYRLNGQRDLYSDDFVDIYESEIEVGEAYVQAGLGSRIDVKIGRQIVVWGKSDNLRVTDIVNPLDLRWPGLVDIRFLRLPVAMSRVDYYQGDWNLQALLIHEPRFNKVPVYNGEFYPGTRPLPAPEEPGPSWSSQQAALSLNGIFSGWDISFYLASVFDAQPYLSDPASARRQYERVLFSGGAGNYAWGNWLFKAEAAYWSGLKYSTIAADKDRLDLLAGLDYSGFSETALTFELSNRHIFAFDDRLAGLPEGQKEDWSQFAFRLTRDLLNDTLHLTLLVTSYGFFDGGFERIQAEYDLNDSLTLTGGVVLYQSGDHPSTTGIGDSDRILVKVEYRF